MDFTVNSNHLTKEEYTDLVEKRVKQISEDFKKSEEQGIDAETAFKSIRKHINSLDTMVAL